MTRFSRIRADRGQVKRHISVVIARLVRATQYAGASQFIASFSGLPGHPVKPGNDSFGWAWIAASILIIYFGSEKERTGRHLRSFK
jgi:hypothetical protein